MSLNNFIISYRIAGGFPNFALTETLEGVFNGFGILFIGGIFLGIFLFIKKFIR